MDFYILGTFLRNIFEMYLKLQNTHTLVWPPMGYLGAGRLGVKGWEIGELDKKWEKGENKCQREKMVNYVREQGNWTK